MHISIILSRGGYGQGWGGAPGPRQEASPGSLPVAVAPLYWRAAAAVGVGGFGLSFLLYNKVISAVDVGWAAVILNLIPAFGLLSSVIFLGEDPGRADVIGACLIGGSVIYVTICDGRGGEADLSPAGALDRSNASVGPAVIRT